jgi:hypothetical protein
VRVSEFRWAIEACAKNTIMTMNVNMTNQTGTLCFRAESVSIDMEGYPFFAVFTAKHFLTDSGGEGSFITSLPVWNFTRTSKA